MVKKIKKNNYARIGGQKRPIDLRLKASIGDGDVVMIDSSVEGSYAATKQTLAKEVASLILSQNQSLVGTFIHSYKNLGNLRDQDGKLMVIEMNGGQYLKSDLSSEANNFINTTIRALGLISGTPEWDNRVQEHLTADYWKDRNVSLYAPYYWQDLGDKWKTQEINEPFKINSYYSRIGFVERDSFASAQLNDFINKLNSHIHNVSYRGPWKPKDSAFQYYTTTGVAQPSNIRTGTTPLVNEGISTPVDSAGNPINFGSNSPFISSTTKTNSGTPCYLYMIVSKYWTNISASAASGGAVNSVNGLSGDVVLKSGSIQLTNNINNTTNIQDCLLDLFNSKANNTTLADYATIDALNLGLDGKVNTADLINPAIVSIPVLATTVLNGTIGNLNLGTPVLLVGDGVVGDYVSVVNNLVKLTTGKRVLAFQAGVLANYSGSNTSRNYRFMCRRPSVVSVPGTTANDILNDDLDVKLTTGTIADCEFNFADTYTAGATDPFNIDGFVFSIDNISGLDITTILTRAGYAKQSYIRISFR